MQLLTIDEAAEYLRFSVSWVKKKTREKQIRCVKFGRHVRYRQQDLDSFVDQRAMGIVTTSISPTGYFDQDGFWQGIEKTTGGAG